MTADPTNPAPPVEELRETLAGMIDAKSMASNQPAHDLCDAALQALAPRLLDHLSSLTVENERLREALEKFCGHMERDDFATGDNPDDCYGLARAALSSLPAMKGEG